NLDPLQGEVGSISGYNVAFSNDVPVTDLGIDPAGKYVYTVSSSGYTDVFPFDPSNGFLLNPNSYLISFYGSQTGFAAHRTSNFIFGIDTDGYLVESIFVNSVDGSLTSDEIASLPYFGSAIATDPSGNFLFTTDLGLNNYL